jgi:hypothetical protein
VEESSIAVRAGLQSGFRRRFAVDHICINGRWGSNVMRRMLTMDDNDRMMKTCRRSPAPVAQNKRNPVSLQYISAN